MINPQSKTFNRVSGPNFLNVIFLKARERKTSILRNAKITNKCNTYFLMGSSFKYISYKKTFRDNERKEISHGVDGIKKLVSILIDVIMVLWL